MANTSNYQGALLGDLKKLESNAQASTILSVSDVAHYAAPASADVGLQMWLGSSATCDILITAAILFLVRSLPVFLILF
jgi:hypothetical protein